MAVELQPDKVLQDRFDQGAQVGALARKRFDGGVMVDSLDRVREARVEDTLGAIEGGAETIFEASFVADDTFTAADILKRDGGGWHLIEVKSASSQKPEHLHETALQLHLLTRNGVKVTGVQVTHLNKDFRHPDQRDLIARRDVTTQTFERLSGVSAEITAQPAMLAGPLPDVPIGAHCHKPRECPFLERCWPNDPQHISKLYNVGPKGAAKYMAAGVHTFSQIPPTKKLPAAALRQLRALRENRLIVEPALADALRPFDVKLGFLDFETIQRAVPVWPGMAPWEQAAAQFSYHEAQADGSYKHSEFLAEGPEDARPALARAMIEATRGAESVVTYSSFEKTRIRGLQQSVPELRDELVELEGKLIDLLPVLRDGKLPYRVDSRS